MILRKILQRIRRILFPRRWRFRVRFDGKPVFDPKFYPTEETP